MVTLIALSLVVIGIGTLAFFKRQNENYHRDRLQRKEHSIMLSLNYFTTENNIQEVNVQLENKIQELADIHNLDLNVYTIDGDLLGSTNLDMYENENRPLKLSDTVMTQLANADEQILINEQIYDLNYLSTYFYLVNADNQNIAIINLPYLKSEEQNKRELNQFLSTLAQIYLGLFIGASLLAYFLVSYITEGLNRIRNRITAFKINSKNEKLSWNSNDEIGALIESYNNLVDKLEDSTQRLAKSERETAWKEMAKQVAHEIKNPLTPMRLSIQHLQRTLKADPADIDSKLARFSNTMIEQIDTLSRIATEFSNFAKMPKAKLESLNIYDVLTSVVDLYNDKEGNGAQLVLKETPFPESHVWADKEQLLRVFGNLVKNAVQATQDNPNGKVVLGIDRDEQNVLVSIRDNGSGIPSTMIDKIFMPSFTTKSSGMGLGLAMVKKIVETAGGQIWFETETEIGTTFYVSLPLYAEESPAKP